jgi:hypothetical protein
MARTLKTTGLAADAHWIVAMDDDGTTLREWVNGWSSTTADNGATWTNNDAASMVVDDGALIGSTTWKGSNETYVETLPGGSFDYLGIAFPTPIGSEASPAALSFFGAIVANEEANVSYWLSADDGNTNLFGINSSGNIVFYERGIAHAAGTTTIPSDGTTKFSVGANIESGNQVEAFYGLESGAIASDGTASAGTLQWAGVGAIGGESGQDYDAPHKFVLWASFNRTLTQQEYDDLHADPFGTLFESASDTQEPTLSSPSVTATGTTAADLSVSTDEGNGTLYWVLSTTNTQPSVAQIQAGNDSTGSAAAASGNQSVSATGTQNASATGLSASTAYYAFFQHQDAAGNDSTVTATGVSVTTDALLAFSDTFADATGTARTSVEIIGYFWDVSGWDPSGTPATVSQTTDGSGNASFTQPSGFSNNPCLAQFVLGDGAGNLTGPSSPLRQVTFA